MFLYLILFEIKKNHTETKTWNSLTLTLIELIVIFSIILLKRLNLKIKFHPIFESYLFLFLKLKTLQARYNKSMNLKLKL